MQPAIRVDPLSATALRVVPIYGQTALASATAFTTIWNGKGYLVTNWHVVAGRNPDTDKCLNKDAAIPSHLTVQFHSKASLGEWIAVSVPLYDDNGMRLWIEHPLGKSVDVVALPIEEVPNVEIYSLDLELADTDMAPYPAMPVSVIGYPLGLAVGGNWPIWKTGHIASDPEIDYEKGRPAFLIDATTRSGMSGAPVILRADSYVTNSGVQVLAGGIATKFVGIYAGRIHEESEVGRVWRPYVLAEILAGCLLFNETTRRVKPSRLSPCPCGRGKRFKECCGHAP